MKKIIAMLLACVMVIGLAACVSAGLLPLRPPLPRPPLRSRTLL